MYIAIVGVVMVDVALVLGGKAGSFVFEVLLWSQQKSFGYNRSRCFRTCRSARIEMKYACVRDMYVPMH